MEFGGGARGVRGDLGWLGPYSRSSRTRAGEAPPASDPESGEGRAAPQRLRESQAVLREPRAPLGPCAPQVHCFPRTWLQVPLAQKQGSLTGFGRTESTTLGSCSTLRPRPPPREALSSRCPTPSQTMVPPPALGLDAGLFAGWPLVLTTEATPPRRCPIINFSPPLPKTIHLTETSLFIAYSFFPSGPAP